MKIVVFSSLAFSLTNFRGDLLREMRANGHKVVAVAPDRNGEVEQELARSGIGYHVIPMRRAGISPLADLWLMLTYLMFLIREQPEMVIAYTQKPIIYAGLVSRMLAIPRFFPIMSGLGQVYSRDSKVGGTVKWIVTRLYRLAVRRSQAIFVFNADDQKDMLDLGIVSHDMRVVQVPGSGVNLTRFAKTEPPTKPLHFLLIARLLRNKGIPEFVEAARQLNESGAKCRFTVLGHMDTENPAGLTQDELTELATDGPVEFVPGTTDVRPYLAACSVFVLPSTYREGLPRTILEAMATGRAVITTDLPGCRDPVVDGENGFLVRPESVVGLAEAMRRFVDDPELAISMGQVSRQLVEQYYDVELVNYMLLHEMDLLGPGAHVNSFRIEPVVKDEERLAPAYVKKAKPGASR